MNIIGTVTKVADDGDMLTIDGTGRSSGMPVWARDYPFTIRIHNSDRSRQSFYVGRDVKIAFKPVRRA